MDDKHVSNATKNDKEQPQNGLPLRREVRSRSVWSYKRLWVVILLFGFIGGVGGFVPASKIPLFSKLIQAMGFSADEAGKMSLLKALLKWNQKYKEEKPRALSDEEIAANARATNERTLALEKEGAAQNYQKNLDSLLIDMHQVNLSQRRSGKEEDAVRAAAKRERGDETEEKVVQVKNADDISSVNTESNADTNGEMLFGQDSSVLQRDEQHGFNSVKMLAKIENPHIAGTTSSTWLTRTMDRAVMADADLTKITKDLNAFNQKVTLAEVKGVGKDRPHRDLSYAWLMGKATYRTRNIMLKKTLAAAGFNGEEMPKRVFDSSLMGVGMGINPDEVSMDAKDMESRYLKEERCRDRLLTSSSVKNEYYQNIKNTVASMRGQFPATCADAFSAGALSNFYAALNTVNQQCNALNNTYAQLQQDCGVAFVQGKCDSMTISYDTNLQNFQNECNKLYEQCLAQTDANGNPNTPAYCAALRDGTTGGALEGSCADGACDADEIYYDVREEITGYGKGEDEAFDQSDGTKTIGNGDNASPFLASQNVHNVFDTLRGLNKSTKVPAFRSGLKGSGTSIGSGSTGSVIGNKK